MRRGAVAIAVVVLAACSSSSKPATPTTAATTTRPTQTTAQVASIVAEHRPLLTEWLAKEDSGCQALTLKASSEDAFKSIQTTPAIELTLVVSGCTGPIEQVNPAASALAQGLAAANPPPEVRALTTDTADAAEALKAANDDNASCIATAGSDWGAVFECGIMHEHDVQALQAKLSAWDAYL